MEFNQHKGEAKGFAEFLCFFLRESMRGLNVVGWVLFYVQQGGDFILFILREINVVVI